MRWFLLVLVAACGRLQFDPLGDGRLGDGLARDGTGDGTAVPVALVGAPLCIDQNGATITISAALTGGNTGIIAFADDMFSVVVDVSDNGGSTWVLYNASAGPAGGVYYASPLHATTAITITLMAATVGSACFYEVSGLAPGDPTESAAIQGTTFPVGGVATGPPVIVTSPNSFVVASADSASAVTGPDPGNAFVNDALLHADGHSHLITTTAGTYTPAWLDSGECTSYTAAFKGM